MNDSENICSACKAAISKEDKFCSNCGARFDEEKGDALTAWFDRQKTGGKVLIWLFFFPIIVTVLIWRDPKLPKALKITLSIMVIVFSLTILGSLSQDKEATTQPTNESQTVQPATVEALNAAEQKRVKKEAEEQRKQEEAEKESKKQEALSHFNNANTLIGQSKWLEAKDELNKAVEIADLPEAKQKLTEIQPQIAAAEESAYKAACQAPPYNQLEKDADGALKNSKVHYLGKIFNIQESNGITVMQINVTDKGYDIWDDQVMVTYPGHVDVYKDDKVHFWGEVTGKTSYESVAGWNLTAPTVTARYVSK